MHALAKCGLCTRYLSAATATAATVHVAVAVATASCANFTAAAVFHWWHSINVFMLVFVPHETGAKTFRLGAHR